MSSCDYTIFFSSNKTDVLLFIRTSVGFICKLCSNSIQNAKIFFLVCNLVFPSR